MHTKENPRSFKDVLNELRTEKTGGKENPPLLFKSWITAHELDLLSKQAFTLSHGCIRHLLYLLLHTGNYLGHHDTNMLNSLIYEYKSFLLDSLFRAIPHRNECRIKFLSERISHANHLLYLIVHRMSFYYSDINIKDDIATIYPHPSGALGIQNSVSLQEIRFLKRMLSRLEKSNDFPPLFDHILFLTIIHGRTNNSDSGLSRLHGLQAGYKSHVLKNILTFIYRKGTDSQDTRNSEQCTAGYVRKSCYRKIFDTSAEEYLLKITGEYMVHSAVVSRASEEKESGSRDFDEKAALKSGVVG